MSSYGLYHHHQQLGPIGGVRDIGPGPEHDQYLWSSKVVSACYT